MAVFIYVHPRALYVRLYSRKETLSTGYSGWAFGRFEIAKIYTIIEQYSQTRSMIYHNADKLRTKKKRKFKYYYI